MRWSTLAGVCWFAFACACQRLSAFVCVCSHLLTPPLGACYRGYNKRGCCMRLCKLARFCAVFSVFALVCRALLCVLPCQKWPAEKRKIVQNRANMGKKCSYAIPPLAIPPYAIPPLAVPPFTRHRLPVLRPLCVLLTICPETITELIRFEFLRCKSYVTAPEINSPRGPHSPEITVRKSFKSLVRSAQK